MSHLGNSQKGNHIPMYCLFIAISFENVDVHEINNN